MRNPLLQRGYTFYVFQVLYANILWEFGSESYILLFVWYGLIGKMKLQNL